MSDSPEPEEVDKTTPPKPESLFALTDLTIADLPGEIDLPPPPSTQAFVHTALSGLGAEIDNIEFPWYWTRLDHPALNGNPNAIISVTPRGRLEFDYENNRANLRQNPHPVGVVYREVTQRWYIYNLNLQPMAMASFNIAVQERYS